jgi:hypothetical protein
MEAVTIAAEARIAGSFRIFSPSIGLSGEQPQESCLG